MASDKKPKAVPNSNPFGLSAREMEVMILAWKCLEEPPKIDKARLAKLAKLGNADSAGRQYRKAMALIKDATVECATPTNGDGSDDASTTTTGAADPESPSVLASDKKKKRKMSTGAGGGKVAGRKRTMKEADDGGSGYDGDKNESEASERPKKIPKHVKGKPVATLKKLEAAQGGVDDDEAGEV